MNTLNKVFRLIANLFTGNKPKTIVLHRRDEEYLPKDNLARVFLKIK